MHSRGPTKRCITLPGVNKPRGRGLARGSPLRLRLLLRLCISSATPFTLIYERRPQYSFPPSYLTCSLLLAPLGIVRRPQTTLSHSPVSLAFLLSGWLVIRKLFSPERTHLEDPPPPLSFLISLHHIHPLAPFLVHF